MMRLSYILTFLLVGAFSSSISQVVLGRQVIGSTGISGSTSSAQISSTSGETAVARYESASFSLTEGFEQPSFSPLLVEAVISFDECWNGNNARIDLPLLAGCGGVLSIMLNGEPASFSTLDLAPGEYLLEITAQGGCSYSEIIAVEAPNLPPCDLNIYNVITPNGDGANDVFVIGNILHPEYLENKVLILNRWGQVVWEGENYDNASVVWDGNDGNGNVLLAGTYFYEITLKEASFTGFISLLP
ncbi:MAG: gliding motility-associated-like protein [Flavobacteriales bacterium]|jgi:gliding motility-associated-like protein